MKHIKKFITNEEKKRLIELLIDNIQFGKVNSCHLIDEIIKLEIDIDSFDNDNQNALLVASFYNRLGIINYLIKKGANINIQDPLSKSTPLIVAAENNYYNTIELLIELGADWTIKNKFKNDFIDCSSDEVIENLKINFPEKYKDYLIKKEADKYNL